MGQGGVEGSGGIYGQALTGEVDRGQKGNGTAVGQPRQEGNGVGSRLQIHKGGRDRKAQGVNAALVLDGLLGVSGEETVDRLAAVNGVAEGIHRHGVAHPARKGQGGERGTVLNGQGEIHRFQRGKDLPLKALRSVESKGLKAGGDEILVQIGIVGLLPGRKVAAMGGHIRGVGQI